ncbi:MAG: ThiF family adenylyltransferase, partial [Desulfobacterales bacterium]|nr:ThiF family adenylyltransferase [Desulfobacterales bacterium]
MTITRSDLEVLAQDAAFPDKTPYRSLSVRQIQELSQQTGMTGREIERAALENGLVPERYARNMRTFSLADQATLLNSHAGVVGLGGLGGTVTEILARMGVGRLTLIDGDRFEDSNLNRQLLSSLSNLSMPKADAAAQRVRQINPSTDVTVHACFLTAENATGASRSRTPAGSSGVPWFLQRWPARRATSPPFSRKTAACAWYTASRRACRRKAPRRLSERFPIP